MQFLPGHTLHRYQITGLQGEGGMGAVYKAYDPRLARDVAIKVMHSHFASQETFQERFMQEARAAARLDHPGIVKIFDSGEENGVLYIIMEFIAGPNLRQILKNLRTEKKYIILCEVVQVMHQICLALDYAHRHGVLHRDIKPDNIMLKPEAFENLPYRPVLTDLGLAKLLEGIPITREGESMGTPAYMSPEQALGHPLDARSDVYSLGILFYELAVGQLPFPAKTLSEAIRYHTKEVPTSPLKIRTNLPESVAAVILKCLEKDPGRRYSHANELANELGKLLPELSTFARVSHPDAEVSLFSQFQAILPHTPIVLNASPQQLPDAQSDQITILSKDRTASSYRIKSMRISIGRGQENDIVIDDPKASRSHARVQIDGGQYKVVDLNSTNGTFLGNTALLPGVPVDWQPDQLLRIGNVWLRLDRVSPRPAAVERRQEPAQPEVSTSVGTRAAITLNPAALTVQPNGSTTLSVTVTNQSPIVDHFKVCIEGIPVEWISYQSPEAQLMPGKRYEASLAIQPPYSPKSRAGNYPLTVKVISRTAPNETVEANAVLTVIPFYRLETGIRPQRQRSSGSGHFTIDLRNQGNADLTILLTGSDSEEGCQYSFMPSRVQISAGEDSQVQLEVQPKAPLTDWRSRNFFFTVTANGEERAGITQQLHGEFEQEAPSLELALRPQRQKGSSQGKFSIQMFNHGQTTLNIRLEGSDPESACRYLFSSSELSIGSGEERTAQLTLEPRGIVFGNQGKVYPFTITARLVGIPGLFRQAHGEWEQVAHHVEMSLVPQKQSGTLSGLFSVQVCNQSDTELQIHFKASDPAGQGNYSLNPPQITLPVGQVRNIELVVRTKSAVREGSTQTIAFEVTAHPAGSYGILSRVQGEWEQNAPAQMPASVSTAAPAGLPEPVKRTEPKQQIFKEETPAPPQVSGRGSCIIWVIGLALTLLAGLSQTLQMYPIVEGFGPMECAIAAWVSGFIVTTVIASRVKRHKTVVWHILFAVFAFFALLYFSYASNF